MSRPEGSRKGLGHAGAVVVRVVWALIALLVLAWCWKKRAIVYYGVTESVYSATLASSMLFVAVGLMATLVIKLGAGLLGSRRVRLLVFASRLCAVGALILVAAAAATHVHFDHSSDGTYGSMGPLLFVKEHPAFWVVVALAALNLWWLRPAAMIRHHAGIDPALPID